MNNKSFNTKRIAQGYAKRPWLHKGVIEELKAEIGDAFENGLDVGCGAGLSSKALHLICKKVTGTDISEEMIEICEELYPEDDFTFYVAKAEETHIPKLKYDIVTAAGVINWVDKDMFLQNMYDVMTADGKLVIYDFGITNQMRENPEYTDWYNNEYLNIFPKPKRNENIWSEKDMNGLMTIKVQRDFEAAYSFSQNDFIDFMLIQSNVNERIQKKKITETKARNWMNETLTPIFMNSMRELVFKGYYWIIEKK